MSEQEKPDELDKLLEEAKPDDQQTVQLLQSIRKDQEEIKAAFESDRKEKTQADVKQVVDALKEKVPEQYRELEMFSDAALEDLLNRKAAQDKDLESAFLGRHSDSAKWESARVGLVDSFAKQFENLPDPALTEDREAVLASAKQQKPTDESDFDEKKITEMSSGDFRKEAAKFGVSIP